ncbi:DinB family protein [Metabacillus arenae]|uniref:Damage-inducible protein DinB n=1 Tax=Metabacillus arenae TaxID=2771434 RepID=A0A926RXB1_9BACI|nr:DinB family protein [Metabacillus arenae]MBD1380480.1 damage-inducible protein DinB [Metabacillus arenae]
MENKTIELFDYNVWGNNRTFNRIKELPESIYTQDVKSVFQSISEVIEHIYLTDLVWYYTMSGKSFDETVSLLGKRKEELVNERLADMEIEYLELSKRYQELFDSREDLEALFTIAHPNFGSTETSIAELVQHVVNHGTYHRGNITAMLRQLGHAGPSTDFIYFLFEKKSNQGKVLRNAD